MKLKYILKLKIKFKYYNDIKMCTVKSMKCNCLLLACELKFNDRWDTVNVCQHSCIKREADQHVQM